ncbi:MAG: glucosyltransferase domain-containing protein [Bacilli bacterium]|nr:glucosyltransferase domain-containing protein [Bacilli bacterium]
MKKVSKEYVILFVIVLVFSLYKIINISFSYDTDIFILNHKIMMNSWIGISRFGLVFLKYIFHLYGDINIRTLNILTYINIFIYSSLFLKFMKADRKDNNLLRNILSIVLIITSPILLEQYNFTLQSVEVSFAMILMVISFITTYKYLKDDMIVYGIITIPLLVICFGTYQSFVNLYIVGALISLYKLSNKDNKKNIIKCIVMFIVSFILYYVISKLCINIMNIDSSNYIADKIGWFFNIKVTLYGIIKDIIKVLVGYGHVLNLGYILCLFIAILYLIKEGKINYKSGYLILLIISPFFLNVITGSRMVLRSMFVIPFLYSFIFFEFYDINKYIKYLLIILVSSQIINCYLLLISDYQRYKNDIEIGYKIYKDCGNNQDNYIYLYGIEKTEENIDVVKGEVMGYSYYEWDNGLNTVAYDRVYLFLQIHNINYKIDDDFIDLDFTEEYPNEGYIIKVDNKCYVNLGD